MNAAAALAALDGVPDPELPMLSVRDLGLIRDLRVDGDAIEVDVTPTYSGCPATEVIAQGVHDALVAAGFASVIVTQRRAPAWTTDWISADGRRKLHEAGIAPPGATAAVSAAVSAAIAIRPRNVACPRCASSDTERLSAFGSTACKSLHRCRACREPFDHFKPL